MARGRVKRGGWTWLGVGREAGDVLEASAAQVAAWAADGLVEPLAGEPEVETAAVAPPENTAKRTRAPRARKEN